jgi:hypothetical protein
MFDLIIRGGDVVTPEGVVRCDVAVAGETIAAIATPKALSAESAKHLNQKRRSPCARARGNDEELDGERGGGSAALNGMKKTTGRRNRRLPFWKSSPALPDRIADRSPVEESSVQQRELPLGSFALSRKLGCGVDTKCPDTHPTRGRRASNSMSVLRRREPAHNTGGRSLSRLQTAYPLPSRRQRRPLPRHSLRPQPEVYTSDKGCL